MNGIGVIGLILGLTGSAMVVLPTFPFFRTFINNQELIQNLETARLNLSKGGLMAGAKGFESVQEIIGNNLDQELSPECRGFHRPELIFKNKRGDEVYHQMLTVYSIDSEGVESDYPSSENYLEDVGSILVIDSWISNEVEKLRTNRIQLVRGGGFGLIVLSVFIQGSITFL